MNSLIRPALYQSHHAVVNLTRLDDGSASLAAVCGPICESGDVLARGRRLPDATVEDDVIVVDCVGAYGRCMASEYNLRHPGEEVVIPP